MLEGLPASVEPVGRIEAEEVGHQGIEMDAFEGRDLSVGWQARASRQKDAVHRFEGRVPPVHSARGVGVSPNANTGSLFGNDNDVPDPRVRAMARNIEALVDQVVAAAAAAGRA